MWGGNRSSRNLSLLRHFSKSITVKCPWLPLWTGMCIVVKQTPRNFKFIKMICNKCKLCTHFLLRNNWMLYDCQLKVMSIYRYIVFLEAHVNNGYVYINLRYLRIEIVCKLLRISSGYQSNMKAAGFCFSRRVVKLENTHFYNFNFDFFGFVQRDRSCKGSTLGYL